MRLFANDAGYPFEMRRLMDNPCLDHGLFFRRYPQRTISDSLPTVREKGL